MEKRNDALDFFNTLTRASKSKEELIEIVKQEIAEDNKKKEQKQQEKRG